MQRFREPVNGFTHLAGALLAALGLIWLLVVTQENAARMLSVAIYGMSMILLFSASAAYHLSNGSERKILWLRRCDHAAIYVLIAGTYTPVFYNLLSGNSRWVMLSLIWGLALLGAGYKLFFLHEAGWISLLCYVALGCVGLVILPQALTVLPPGTAIYIAMGGAMYVLGVVIFGLERPNPHRYFGHHEIWHVLVMGGSLLHFAAMLRFLSA